MDSLTYSYSTSSRSTSSRSTSSRSTSSRSTSSRSAFSNYSQDSTQSNTTISTSDSLRKKFSDSFIDINRGINPKVIDKTPNAFLSNHNDDQSLESGLDSNISSNNKTLKNIAVSEINGFQSNVPDVEQQENAKKIFIELQQKRGVPKNETLKIIEEINLN